MFFFSLFFQATALCTQSLKMCLFSSRFRVSATIELHPVNTNNCRRVIRTRNEYRGLLILTDDFLYRLGRCGMEHFRNPAGFSHVSSWQRAQSESQRIREGKAKPSAHHRGGDQSDLSPLAYSILSRGVLVVDTGEISSTTNQTPYL